MGVGRALVSNQQCSIVPVQLPTPSQPARICVPYQVHHARSFLLLCCTTDLLTAHATIYAAAAGCCKRPWRVQQQPLAPMVQVAPAPPPRVSLSQPHHLQQPSPPLSPAAAQQQLVQLALWQPLLSLPCCCDLFAHDPMLCCFALV